MYDVEMMLVAAVLGVSVRSIEHWHHLFKKNGNLLPKKTACLSARWSAPAVVFVDGFMKLYPCFYLEDIQEAVKANSRLL
ncbi:hypothetical protein PHMEG_0009060 [Phytophthora megakarya]|uniref:Uncharacterized protein n=1 Tax=Phytophthora megakarya TaxID=4795 RepID=A0A225WHF5_9STRA|nr:hypothetical protein PHMEG_0009060 [Phytophthora megakarya]